MNRTTIIFLALAVLLAHALSLHQTKESAFAAPYDRAHVAFRLGRNLVHSETPRWNPGRELVESYPSPLWVGFCAVAERATVSPSVATQTLGILCILATVVVLAQFSTDRMAGLIAPALLAVSGSAAASGASGTEMPLAMLLSTTTFLAFERRWPRVFALALCLMVLTRPGGLALVVGFAALEFLDPPRAVAGRSSLRPALLSPAVLVLLMAVVRRALTGSWLSPYLGDLVALDPGRIALGASYLKSFLLASGSAVLVVLPAALFLAGRLSATGRRALVLFLFWIAAMTLSGGDSLPMWVTMAPIVPLLFLAVQEAMTRVMDRRPRLAPAMWTVLLAAVGASALVSKSPGDVGPIPIGELHRAWMQPDPRMRAAFGHQLGRLGLLEEIHEVERLRSLGIFLRDRIDATSDVLTLWPGAVGYLSRKNVFDLLGRASPLKPGGRVHSWNGLPKVDLVQRLASGAAYVVAFIDPPSEGTTPLLFLHELLRRYDEVGDREQRLLDLLAVLSSYELVSVPVPARSDALEVPSTTPFLLLQAKRLSLSPRVELELDGRDFRVLVHHGGHQQVVDLKVELQGANGEVWTLRPTGVFAPGPGLKARTDIMIYPTGERPIVALAGRLPAEHGAKLLTASLHNPGSADDSRLVAVGKPVALELQ
jgi:hypothetical protein